MKLLLCLFFVFTFVSCFGDKKTEAPSEVKTETAAKAESGEFTGYDLKGEERSCGEMPKDMMCTMQMTPEDEFGIQCKEAGHTAHQCGCHDWLCSENLAAAETK